MVEHLKCFVDELIEILQRHEHTEGIDSRFQVLGEEIERLETAHFLPVARGTFLEARRRLRKITPLVETSWRFVLDDDREQLHHLEQSRQRVHLAAAVEMPAAEVRQLGSQDGSLPHFIWRFLEVVVGLLRDIRSVIDTYLGQQSVPPQRCFDFLKDGNLRRVVERDYNDLTVKVLPVGAWKSAVILAGSILEGVLHAQLTRTAGVRAKAITCGLTVAPRTKGKDITKGEWSLSDYIKVADGLGLLPAGWEPSVQVVLREYRNYVHPFLEACGDELLNQGEALQAIGALIKVCDHFERQSQPKKRSRR